MRIFGGEITHMNKFSNMPPNPNFIVPDGMMDKVLHRGFETEGQTVLCSDSFGRHSSGDSMYISITANKGVVQKAWDELKNGGQVMNDLAPTFFAPIHGSLLDRFGICWMFTVGLDDIK